MIYGLDLFTGIGGISLALEPWIRPIAYCENDRYAQSVLLSRMQDGALPLAPIWDDVRTLRKEMLPEIDIIYGGFPCQDISVAGAGKGLEGERSGLFFEIIRLTSELNPSFVFLENVPAIRTRGLREVIRAFTNIGYDCRWTCVSAAEVGAPHLRKRWFLLAHARGKRHEPKSKSVHGKNEKRESYQDIFSPSVCENVSNAHSESLRHEQQRMSWGRAKKLQTKRKIEPGIDGKAQPLAHSYCLRKLSKQETGKCAPDRISHSSKKMAYAHSQHGDDRGHGAGPLCGIISKADKVQGRKPGINWWSVESPVGRVVNGLPQRVDRLKCLGNAVVPMQAQEAFKRLMGINP